MLICEHTKKARFGYTKKCLALGAQKSQSFEKRCLEPIHFLKNEPNPFLFEKRLKPISLKVRVDASCPLCGAVCTSSNSNVCLVTWC